MTDPAAPETVTAFWFGPLENGLAADAQRRRWFTPDPAFDDEIRQRFGHLVRDAYRGRLNHWLDSPLGLLAFILVTDQFSRQVYRGQAQAYDTDAAALAAARQCVDTGADRQLALDERAFCYLPFEHAEARLDQHTAVGLYMALRDDTPAGARHLTGDYLRHAQQHRDIVLRFGRFPHRNRVLGRESTAEEREYLESAPSYGQG